MVVNQKKVILFKIGNFVLLNARIYMNTLSDQRTYALLLVVRTVGTKVKSSAGWMIEDAFQVLENLHRCVCVCVCVCVCEGSFKQQRL
jgi:uncharacterized membrane protein